MEEFSADTCVICKLGFDQNAPGNTLYKKGLETLMRVCKQHERPDVHQNLVQKIQSNQKIKVHHTCRRKFTDTRKSSSESLSSPKRLRSSVESNFDWKFHCVLCEKVIDVKHQPYHVIMTIDFHQKLAARAKQRNDEWGKKVLFRLENCNDLVAKEAKYHHACMTSFQLWDESCRKKGRPLDKQMLIGFEKLCTWLEEKSDCELYTLEELQTKMQELNKPDPVYTVKRLKQ